MDSAPYSVTKHGTVALAEWLAIRWGDAGVGVSCLCPQGVRAPWSSSSVERGRGCRGPWQRTDRSEAIMTHRPNPTSHVQNT
jgi:NAD(P)-dependent dehydrogenase (short-subunit alcohol dehydrogenase family)